MHIQDYVFRQLIWSGLTFGPGDRTAGVIDHIRKELAEIEADPDDVKEWIDVIILAMDGAWRKLVANGMDPKAAANEVEIMLHLKYLKNERRKWPDWRTTDPGKAIEHVKEEEERCWEPDILGPDR
jgi:hypothetical protein